MSIVRDKYRGTMAYHLIYSELIAAARYRGSVTYQEIAKIIGLPLSGNHMGHEIGQLLSEIAEDEFIADRPMLSAIAIKANGSPGPGFFNLARNLKKLSSGIETDERTFWEKERKDIYDTWKVALK